MKLNDSIELQAGGTGSGPNKPCPQCGPRGHTKTHIKVGDKVYYVDDYGETKKGIFKGYDTHKGRTIGMVDLEEGEYEPYVGGNVWGDLPMIRHRND